MALLEIENLTFTYNAAHTNALENISFSVGRGEFVCVCGPTGSGKTTLIRLLKREISPAGSYSGRILFDGQDIRQIDERTAAAKIGYVCQKPEQQIVCDKVWHELAFGLENLGLPNEAIRRRVSEMACYFGMEDMFDKRTDELSGGQKQLLNLASVMIMQPDVLLLDEPTAQLDPIAAAEFISTVHRLKTELSLTVIMIEHRLEDALPLSDKVLALENGRLKLFGPARAAAAELAVSPAFRDALPSALRLWGRFDIKSEPPFTVGEGRAFIESSFSNRVRALTREAYSHSDAPALEFKNVYFRYDRNGADALKNLSFTVYEGEIFCILGGNGSGKSTCLSAASALVKPYAGQIRVFGKKLKDYKNQTLYRNCLSLLPQDAQTLFLHNTLREELDGVDTQDLPFDLTPYYSQHPYDLSGGQQQLAALAKVLDTKPRLLLLDEPTKGLDARAKHEFVRIIKALRSHGVSVVCVTHDVELACLMADRCAMFFRGEAVSCAPAAGFFADSSFYTTAISRMTRGYYEGVSTLDEAERICRLNVK
ncbi:MAG: energy-coupling factor ABC transporter ATP-binding protein [Clostridia bacterium]|nr:energy-coupling factor ABC transporter ATP-binding protein [Clostridia bacterium]